MSVLRHECECGNELRLEARGNGTWHIVSDAVQATCNRCDERFTSQMKCIVRMEKRPETVREMAEAGAICELYGHWWVESDNVGLTLPVTHFRSCNLCGHKQSGRTFGGIQWEDVSPPEGTESGNITIPGDITIGKG